MVCCIPTTCSRSRIKRGHPAFNAMCFVLILMKVNVAFGKILLVIERKLPLVEWKLQQKFLSMLT
jgi:hypothetical protein